MYFQSSLMGKGGRRRGHTVCASFGGIIDELQHQTHRYNILILPTTGRYFQVPYGCMVPKKIDNLLVAGRCVAGDKTSHAAMRNMMAYVPPTIFLLCQGP